MTVWRAVRESLRLLSKRDRRLLAGAALIQVLASGLDLVGVLLFGLVGALSVTTIQSQPPPSIVTDLADRLGLGTLSEQELVVAFTAMAAIILATKTALSAILLRRVLKFLANRQALVSGRLVEVLLSRPMIFLQRRTSQETAYALIQGAGAATIAILGQLLIVITEAAVLVVLAMALLLIDPWVTVGATLYFGAIALLLQRLMGGWATRLGETGRQADINSLTTVQDAVASYREITVLQRTGHFIRRFQDLRWQSASVAADRTFLLQIPKYVFEVALIIGGVVLASVLFATKDSVVAVSTLALFIAAASRVMPSILRLQGSALALRDNAAGAAPTFELAQDLQAERPTASSADRTEQPWKQGVGVPNAHPEKPAEVRAVEVSVRYPGSIEWALEAVSLHVTRGSTLAIVGRSGAGKSTLVDVMLGLLDPQTGLVSIDDLPPQAYMTQYPGRVAYVPQVVALVNGTVRENVALGLAAEQVTDDQVWSALAEAHLEESFRAAPLGLHTPIGERGLKISGGQRQRIGIARALLSKPTLLILDEATSALDAETEGAISDLLADLHGRVTVVVVAHRLSTVRNADQVIYLDRGQLLSAGSFDHVRRQVPAFDRQAQLMGL